MTMKKLRFAIKAGFLILLFTLPLIFGCAEQVPATPDYVDQAGEEPVEEGKGTADPWEINDDPAITIRSPVPGAFSQNIQVPVSGVVTGDIDELKINGQTLTPNSAGVFQGAVRCQPQGPILPINAEVRSGETVTMDRVTALYGNGLSEDQLIPNAIAVNATDRFMDVIAEQLNYVVLNFPFDQILDLINPLIDENGLYLEITALEIGDMDLQMSLEDAGLRVTNAIFDLHLELHAEINVGPLNLIVDGVGHCDRVDFTALAVVEDNPQGLPQIVLQQTQTQLEGLYLHIDNVPDWIINIFDGLVGGGIEFFVDALFTAVIPGVINTIIGAINIETEILDLAVMLPIDTFDIDASGISAAFGANIRPLAPMQGVPVLDESLYSGGAPPDFQGTVPGTDEPYDLAITVSDDIWNRGFYAIVKNGLLNIDLASPITLTDDLKLYLNAGSLALLFPSLEDIDPQLPVIVRLTPGAQPIVSTNSTGGREGMFSIPNYTFSVLVDTHDPQFGKWEAFAVSFDLYAETGLEVDDQGAISLTLTLPTFDATVLRNPIGEDRVELIDGAVDLLHTVLDELFDSLATVKITLPDLLGYKIVPKAFFREGEKSDYFSLYIAFDPIAENTD